jgi:hypothetical protein
MSDDSESKANEAAEKAYAAAASSTKAAEPATPVTAKAPVETPAVAAARTDAQPAPAVPAEKPAPVKAAAIRKPAGKPALSKVVAPAPAKPAAAKPVAKAPAKKTVPAKPVAKKAAPVRKAKPAKPAATPVAPVLTIPQLKERIMATASKKTDFSKVIDTAVSTVKTKAKAAYDKGTAVAGEVGSLSKGNIEAVVESSKILAAGMKDIGADYVAETKSAYETVTGDFKKFAAIKSPTELFQLQGELIRRNFDSAVAFGSKETEKLVKLTNDAFAPISTRVSLIVDKVSKAA